MDRSDTLFQIVIKMLFVLALMFALFWSVLFSTYAHATGCNPGSAASPQVISTFSSGDVTAATATATMTAPSAAQSWNVTGIDIWGNYATGASVVVCTITGLQGGTQTIDVNVGVISTAVANPVTTQYTCPKTGVAGTAVVFSCPTFGSGNTHAAIDISGFLQ
jgi:hypothetical protein